MPNQGEKSPRHVNLCGGVLNESLAVSDVLADYRRSLLLHTSYYYTVESVFQQLTISSQQLDNHHISSATSSATPVAPRRYPYQTSPRCRRCGTHHTTPKAGAALCPRKADWLWRATHRLRGLPPCGYLAPNEESGYKLQLHECWRAIASSVESNQSTSFGR